MIESSTGRRIKKLKKYKKSARSRREDGVFIAEGWKMTEEAFRRKLVEAVYVAASAKKEWEKKNLFLKYPDLEKRISVEFVLDSVFDEITDTVTPQGVIALVRMPEYPAEKFGTASNASLLVLEDIQDPGNLGTMIRTAEGAGMTGVVLGKGCVDLFNPKVVRSTMGALYRVPYRICEELSTEVELLKKQGFTVYAAHLAGTTDYTKPAYKGKTAVMIGNEANGLSKNLASMADCFVKIPMEGELESLNAAVSAALLMYEIHRNR